MHPSLSIEFDSHFDSQAGGRRRLTVDDCGKRRSTGKGLWTLVDIGGRLGPSS
jgi:hypothetical protein